MMKEATFEGVGGLKIFFREWQPAAEPRGVVFRKPPDLRVAW